MLVNIEFTSEDADDILQEFIELVTAAGLDNLSCFSSKRDKPDAKYFVGKGKAQEIQRAVNHYEAEVVIFNHELSPAQGRNLEKLFCCRVIDRTELILDIFAQRARSFEGQLQVELAQLAHLRTRLIKGWTHLERQKGGIGLRGPGETQLETDRRLVDVRIKSIRKKLDKVLLQREQNRKQRRSKELPTISLVGYTNAGKSTLFNVLTAENIFAADQLFATLDTTLRSLSLENFGDVIVADTVGFIRDLPHDLVAAFRATLEEAVQADLLLHVVDVSSDHRQDLMSSVNTVLAKIEAETIPQLIVYNKCDLEPNFPSGIEYDSAGVPWRVCVSALNNQGLDHLKQAIAELLVQNHLAATVILQPTQAKLRAKLYDIGAVKNEQRNADGSVILSVLLSRQDYNRYIKPLSE